MSADATTDHRPRVIEHLADVINANGPDSAEHYLEARTEANLTGNHLVTVNDAAENTWLYNAFGTIAANQGARLWIGFTDEISEGNFVWDNGEAVTFTSWDPPSGEPNGGVLENYTEIITTGGSSSLGNWNDNNEDAINFGIIESSSPINSPVPEPLSFAVVLSILMLVTRFTRSKKQLEC